MLNQSNSSRGPYRFCLRVKRLFSLLLCLVAFPAQAVMVDDLYVADVLVTDESAGQLRTGARAGLLQVLVRVSGRLDVEQSSLVRNSLRNPAAYYYQYSYESTDRTLFVGGQEVPARQLRLHFEPSAVAKLLRDAELPVWGSNRPGILLWIVVNDSDGRRILGEAEAAEVLDGLIDQADLRGLPVMFPILDLEDASQISVAEVWGAFLDRIARASARYSPDAILTARLSREPGGTWSGRWSWMIDDGWTSSERTAFSSDELARSMVDLLADELSSRYALGSSRDSVRLVVEGVSELADYAALSSYLEQLTPVLNSTIVALQGDVAEFRLQIEGQDEQLIEIIKLDERLSLLNHSGERLHYRWTSQ